MRRRFFDYFLVRIAQKQHFYYCPATQDFLRTKGLDMEKVNPLNIQHYQSTANPNGLELAAEYKKIFGFKLGNDTQAQFRNTANTFYVFLKKAKKEL